MTITITGKCSTFGGPSDHGVGPAEPVEFVKSVDECPELFLARQPYGTTGTARRLNPAAYYLAIRPQDSGIPHAAVRGMVVEVSAIGGDGRTRKFQAHVADWGPNRNTGRVADLSPGLADALCVDTDALITVRVPWPPTEPVAA